MGRWLEGVHYVSTGLVVSALARPEWLVEIDATAVIPAERRAEAAAVRAAAMAEPAAGSNSAAGREGEAA